MLGSANALVVEFATPNPQHPQLAEVVVPVLGPLADLLRRDVSGAATEEAARVAHRS